MTAAVRPSVGRSFNASTRVKTRASSPDATIYILGVASLFGIWRLQEIIPGAAPLKLPVLTLVVGILSFFASRPASALSDIAKHPAIQCVLAIAVLAVLGGPFAIVRGYSLIFVVFDFAPSILLGVFIAAAIRNESDARWLLASLVIGGVIFYMYARGTAGRDRSGRPSGIIFYDANDFALLSCMSSAIALGLAHTARRIGARALWLLCAAILLHSVLWTVSRGAFIAVVVCAAYLAFSPVLPVAKRASVLTIGLVGLLAVGGRSYVNQMKTMLTPDNDYNFSGNSPNGRGEVWKRGMKYVWQRPLMGAGARNYTAAEARSDFAMSRLQENKGYKLSRAHNSYLEIAVEMGIPGFVLYTMSLFGVLWRLHRRSRAGGRTMTDSQLLAAYLAAAIAGLIVGGFFLSAQYWTMVYAIIGIAAALTVTQAAKSPKSAAPVAARPIARKRLGTHPASAGFTSR